MVVGQPELKASSGPEFLEQGFSLVGGRRAKVTVNPVVVEAAKSSWPELVECRILVFLVELLLPVQFLLYHGQSHVRGTLEYGLERGFSANLGGPQ